MSKVLLVGESPPRSEMSPERWLTPETDSGRRLVALTGWSAEEYLRRLDRTNLLSDPGWLPRAAVGAARLMCGLAPSGQRFLLLGRRVWCAFSDALADAGGSLPEEQFRWSATRWADSLLHFAWIPHPSGRCREWNDPATRGACRAFFAGLLDRTCSAAASRGRLRASLRPDLKDYSLR